jgi:nucleotide-binding universal stress UspA family protein
MFRNVLVPLHAGFMPRITLMNAAALASEGANITLLHVTDVPQNLEPTVAITALVEDAIERYEAGVRAVMGNALAILSEYGASASTLVVYGRPVHDVINRTAKNIDADVILIGTHGRRGLSRAWSGSVTEEVMRRARVPVLVIRESRATVVPAITPRWTVR